MELVLVLTKQPRLQFVEELEWHFLWTGRRTSDFLNKTKTAATCRFNSNCFQTATIKSLRSLQFLYFPYLYKSFLGFKWTQNIWMRELFHSWQVLLWFLPPWNDRWWLTVISGPVDITDNPDQFFPPAGVEQEVFSQDRRRALIGRHPVKAIICASHCNLLWLMEPQLNLHLIRPLHRNWHSS